MATIKRMFTKQELRAWEMPHEPPPGGKIISDRIDGHRRWSVDHELIFRLPDQPEGEAWRVSYSVGATESQDERPWEYEDEVGAVLVRAVEKTVTVWEPVPATSPEGK